MALGSDSGRGLSPDAFGTSLSVEAGPIILGCSLNEPVYGEVGAYGTSGAIRMVQEQDLAKDKLTYVRKITGT